MTSSAGGIGVEFVSAEGGVLYFKDPRGTSVSFGYGAAGAGLAVGFKLPKIGKLAVNVGGKSVVGAVAPASFPNAGKLFVLDTCPDSDLTVSDIRGVCLFGEIGGGLVVGEGTPEDIAQLKTPTGTVLREVLAVSRSS